MVVDYSRTINRYMSLNAYPLLQREGICSQFVIRTRVVWLLCLFLSRYRLLLISRWTGEVDPQATQ